jgi:hypothetical protein
VYQDAIALCRCPLVGSGPKQLGISFLSQFQTSKALRFALSVLVKRKARVMVQMVCGHVNDLLMLHYVALVHQILKAPKISKRARGRPA